MLLRNWMPFLFVIFHKDIHWCWSFIHFLRPFQCGNLYPSVLRCFLEFMFGIFSCLSLELLLLRHWTLWIHAVIFLPFFPLFCIFRFIIFYVNMFDLSYPIECYKYLLLYFNFLFIFSWIHEYKILSLSFWDFFFLIWRIIALQNFVFCKYQHEWTIGIHMSPPSWPPSRLPPHPTPLDCYFLRLGIVIFLFLFCCCFVLWFGLFSCFCVCLLHFFLSSLFFSVSYFWCIF